MAMNAPEQGSSMKSHQSFSQFVATHEGLVIGGGIVLVLVLAGMFMKSKTGTPPAATPNSLQDLSGLTNGLIYVPTSTTFETINKNSNNPTTTGSNNTTTTTTTTTTTNKGDNDKGSKTPVSNPPPPRQPPPPQPKPPVTTKKLIWDQRYTILGGDTLSAIASRLTTRLRAQGMPGSASISWNDLYAHNTNVINATSAAHHNPIPGGPWNDIFPGETITVPRWG